MERYACCRISTCLGRKSYSENKLSITSRRIIQTQSEHIPQVHHLLPQKKLGICNRSASTHTLSFSYQVPDDGDMEGTVMKYEKVPEFPVS